MQKKNNQVIFDVGLMTVFLGAPYGFQMEAGFFANGDQKVVVVFETTPYACKLPIIWISEPFADCDQPIDNCRLVQIDAVVIES